MRTDLRPQIVKRLALLTNVVPPQRVDWYRRIGASCQALRIFTCCGTEPNRRWNSTNDRLDIVQLRSLMLARSYSSPKGFKEVTYLHLPYNTLSALRRFRPDAIIAGEMGLRALQAVAYVALNRRTRLILWADLSDHTELGRGALRQLVRPWLLKRADAVIVQGAGGARYVTGHGFDATRVFSVPIPTDISLATGTAVGSWKPQLKNHLVIAGRMVPLKNLIPFLKAVSECVLRGSGARVTVHFIGEGPSRREIEQFPIPPCLELRCWGEVPYREMPQHLLKGAILAFPTLSDTWGNVVNEAMSLGLPVLGSSYSQAVEELVEEGVNGWVFRPDDPSEIRCAVERALGTPEEELVRMSAAAKRKALSLTPQYAADLVLEAVRGVKPVERHKKGERAEEAVGAVRSSVAE